MEINSNYMLGSSQPLLERIGSPDAPSAGQTGSGRRGSVNERISPLGSLVGNMPALNVDQQAELRAFRDEMRAALTSGSFDATEMAGKAPEFMQQHAADNGVSLESAFQQLDDRLQSLQALKPGLAGIGGSDPRAGQNNLLQSLLTSLGQDE